MKSFLFKRRDPKVEARNELHEAELALLNAQSAAEYADSQVAYNISRIERLKDFLGMDVPPTSRPTMSAADSFGLFSTRQGSAPSRKRAIAETV